VNPAAVTTASRSSVQLSNVGRSANDTGSESPVPRWSYDTTVANDDSRSNNESNWCSGARFSRSWNDSHAGTTTIMCGPPARTLNASLASPLIA
jgi:hypothetical protein